MFDSHVHVGQFYEMYVSPQALSNFMKEIGVDHYAVSSTTMCEENYSKALDELRKLRELDGERMLPVLWITPNLLQENKEIIFLDSELPWACIKIHPETYEDYWQTEIECMDYVVSIAKDLNVPVLIHTGEKNHCEAHRFKNLIERHPQQNFILAHGRPLPETIDLLKRYDNTWADSAFMPVKDMMTLLNEGLEQKILWGTDMCIPQHFYPNENMIYYYKKKLKSFHKGCTEEQFELVTQTNAINLFKISEL